MLQFGHGSDAVEDQEYVTRKASEELLQFGHGSDAVEDCSGRNA
jgi:hypothetical protein